MTVNGIWRAPATLAGAAVAGALLWLAAQIGRHSIGGYWAAYGIVAAAGAVLALSQIRGRHGHPRAMFLLVFLPVLVTAGWVLVALQPAPTITSVHVRLWSEDIGIADVVYSVGTWLGVLAFGIGYTAGATIEPPPRRPLDEEPPVARGYEPTADEPATDERAADEPTAAERTEASDEPRRYPAPR